LVGGRGGGTCMNGGGACGCARGGGGGSFKYGLRRGGGAGAGRAGGGGRVFRVVRGWAWAWLRHHEGRELGVGVWAGGHGVHVHVRVHAKRAYLRGLCLQLVDARAKDRVLLFHRGRRRERRRGGRWRGRRGGRWRGRRGGRWRGRRGEMWRGGRAAGAAALGLLVVLPAAAACTVAARPTAPLTDSVLARWCPGGGAAASSVKRARTSSSSTRIRTLLSIFHTARLSSPCNRNNFRTWDCGCG
jgi:hypothetical protein